MVEAVKEIHQSINTDNETDEQIMTKDYICRLGVARKRYSKQIQKLFMRISMKQLELIKEMKFEYSPDLDALVDVLEEKKKQLVDALEEQEKLIVCNDDNLKQIQEKNQILKDLEAKQKLFQEIMHDPHVSLMMNLKF